MSISRTADLFYTYRFIRILTTKWEDMEAYEHGIVDENGNQLKKARDLKTSEEKDSYSFFHRLVFNIKRLLEKLPFGKTKLASYAAALFLIKENTNMSEEQIEDVMRSMFSELDFDPKYSIDEDCKPISGGVYRLTEDTILPSTCEAIIPAGTKVMVDVEAEPVSSFFGIEVYEATHVASGEKLYVTAQGLR